MSSTTSQSTGCASAMVGAGSAVTATGLVKSYQGRRGSPPLQAVKGVDLDVAPGEVFGFLGPNGAGKTTTVRMLTTLLSITSGSATVAGVDVARDPAGVRQRTGVALQEAGLDPTQTGRELVTLQAGLHGLRGAVLSRKVEELLDLVGMQEAADRIIRSYSGGMKRRLDLASALVHEPQVLFLDEPTTGLDPASRQSVWEEVRRINRAGTTVFLTTQYLEEADQLCDRLAIIDGGRIVREGTPDSLKSSLGSDSVSLGVSDPQGARQALQGFAGIRSSAVDAAGLTVHCDDGAAAVPGIVQRIAAAGIALRTVTVKRPTLDDVFMAATGRHILEEDQRA